MTEGGDGVVDQDAASKDMGQSPKESEYADDFDQEGESPAQSPGDEAPKSPSSLSPTGQKIPGPPGPITKEVSVTISDQNESKPPGGAANPPAPGTTQGQDKKSNLKGGSGSKSNSPKSGSRSPSPGSPNIPTRGPGENIPIQIRGDKISQGDVSGQMSNKKMCTGGDKAGQFYPTMEGKEYETQAPGGPGGSGGDMGKAQTSKSSKSKNFKSNNAAHARSVKSRENEKSQRPGSGDKNRTQKSGRQRGGSGDKKKDDKNKYGLPDRERDYE